MFCIPLLSLSLDIYIYVCVCVYVQCHHLFIFSILYMSLFFLFCFNIFPFLCFYVSLSIFSMPHVHYVLSFSLLLTSATSLYRSSLLLSSYSLCIHRESNLFKITHICLIFCRPHTLHGYITPLLLTYTAFPFSLFFTSVTLLSLPSLYNILTT